MKPESAAFTFTGTMSGALLGGNAWLIPLGASWFGTGETALAIGAFAIYGLNLPLIYFGRRRVHRDRTAVPSTAVAILAVNAVLLAVLFVVAMASGKTPAYPVEGSGAGVLWVSPLIYAAMTAVAWHCLRHIPAYTTKPGRFSPKLNPGVYVYIQAIPEVMADCVMTFREGEGITGIMKEEDAARAGLSTSFRSAWITLELPTQLEEVGITATVSTALAAARIPCNVVAAFHHDHLFVPVESGETARDIIARL